MKNTANAPGFSLIEVVLALFLLILLAGFTATGVLGVLGLEADSQNLQEAAEIARYVREERRAGISDDDILDAVTSEWPAAVVERSEVENEAGTDWMAWTIKAHRDGPDVAVEFLTEEGEVK